MRAGHHRRGARLEALPDFPTVGEFVPGFETSAWYVVVCRGR